MKIIMALIALSLLASAIDSFAQSVSRQIELRGVVPSHCEDDTCNDPNVDIYINENGKKTYQAN